MIDPKKVFIVIPAYNETEVIASVISRILPYRYSIVVVDDGSCPGLYPLIKEMPVFFLRHKVNLGQGAAIQTGLEFSVTRLADYIVTFDADGQHDANDIEKLLQILIGNQLDIVLGSRFIATATHIPWRRKWLLQLARWLNYFFTGLFLTDAHNGFRVMNRKAAMAIRLTENGMAHATEILICIKKNQLHFTEAPVHVYYTDYSRRKGQGLWNSFRIFFDILLNKIFG